MDGKIQGFQNAIMPIRRELLTLRSYYDEIMDMGKQLEENENGFFAKKQVKYFGVISDRADRLMSKASQLLEYAQQVRDAYKAQVDAQQNNNMQFLTVISTIFFPLTFITSWYGMISIIAGTKSTDIRSDHLKRCGYDYLYYYI